MPWILAVRELGSQILHRIMLENWRGGRQLFGFFAGRPRGRIFTIRRFRVGIKTFLLPLPRAEDEENEG